MSKKKLPWFPCYPDDWLEDTQGMTDAQARVYWDFLCVLYINEKDGVLHATNKWIAHELHAHINKWLAARKFLIAAGKLVETADGGLTNNRAAKVCLERKARSESLGEVAKEREAERKEYRDQNPTFDLKGGTAKRPALYLVADEPMGVTPPSNPPQLPPPVTPPGCQAISLSNQRGSDHECAPHSTSSHSTEEKESLSNASPIDEEEEEARAPPKPRRKIPSRITKALVNTVGQAEADELINDYFESGFADGAKFIGPAFKGWLLKQNAITIRIASGNTPSLGELLEICGGDTSLKGSAEALARRRA